MKLYQIYPLLQDMRRNKVKQDKFSFRYANLQFQVIFLIEREPFELLFGVIDHNYSFTLCLHRGFELDDMSDDVYFYLRRLMKLQKCDEVLTSYKLMQFFAARIPKKYSGKKLNPMRSPCTNNGMYPSLKRFISRAGEAMRPTEDMSKTWRRQNSGWGTMPMSTVKSIISVPVGAIVPVNASHIILQINIGKNLFPRHNGHISTRVYK